MSLLPKRPVPLRAIVASLLLAAVSGVIGNRTDAYVTKHWGSRMAAITSWDHLPAAILALGLVGLWWWSHGAPMGIGGAIRRVLRKPPAHEIDLAKLRASWAIPAADQLDFLHRQIAGAARQLGESELLHLAESLMVERVTAASNAMRAWGDSHSGGEEIQRLAGDAYRAYQRAVQTMREFARSCGIDATACANYEVWKRHDAAYLDGLNTLRGHPHLATLERLVYRHMWPAAGQRDYSDFESPAAGQRLAEPLR